MTRIALLVLSVCCAGLAPRPSGASGPAPVSVKTMMLKEISPAFTDVSFQLYHAPEPSKEKLIELTGKLEEVSASFSRASAKSHSETDFRASAVLLRASIEGFKLAVFNDAPREDLEHWFGHVGAACNSCHAVARDGQ